MAISEKISQDDLILFEILKNPVLCGEFINNVDKVEWEDEFKYDLYQKEMLCDFNSYVSICTARSIGKTVSLVGIILWALINNIFPGDHLLYTVPNKNHLLPVWKGLVRSLRSNSLLKHFTDSKRGINSSDYIITLKNQAQLFCRIAGQTGTGVSVVGLHTPFELADEIFYYPYGTWIELQPTLNTFTQGFRLMVAGVPTGLRENCVGYQCDMEDSSYTKHRVSAHENPRFTEKDDKKAIEQYGGKDSDDYIHLILGRHGSAVFSVFDRRLFNISNNPVYRLVINGIKIRKDVGEYVRKLALFPRAPEKNNGIIFGIDLGYCYSEDTEVLTSRGWLKHNDISLEDTVACFNTENDEIVWDKPLYIWEQDYKGKMIEVSGKSTNFCVSPEHSIWTSKTVGNKHQEYEKLKAKDLLTLSNKMFRVRLLGKNKKQIGPKTFKVPYYYCDRSDREKKDTNVKMSDWVQFLGWFISEGSATANRNWEINLTQQVGEKADKIDRLLKRLPYTISKKEFTTQWGKQQINWRITCKELTTWLRENCGVHAKNKKIPEFIFDTSTDDQELFLDTLLLGDGTRLNSNRCPLYTSSSHQLLDQVQRLIISLGYSSTKSFSEEYGMGTVSIMTRKENLLFRDKNVKEIDYDGKIYCLKTTTGFYITRRNGRIAIQGNTEPTCIVILYQINDRLKFHGRIRLNKVSYDIQEKIIDMLDTKFNPSIIGIDEGSAGKAVVQRLHNADEYLHKDYEKRLIPINFSSNIMLGMDADGNEIKSKTKPFSVSVLQDYSNNHKLIYSSTDLEMISELERMTYSKNPRGDISYRTLTPKGGQRGEDHFTAALLCAMLAYYLENESLQFKKRVTSLFSPRWLKT